MFDAMRRKFQVEQKAKDEEIERKAAAEEKANEERQERLKKMNKERAEMMANLDLTKPLGEIPDCVEKYDKIIADLSQTGGGKYTDDQFPHTDEVKTLGQANVDNKELLDIVEWKRISEMEGAVIYSDGATYQDIE